MREYFSTRIAWNKHKKIKVVESFAADCVCENNILSYRWGQVGGVRWIVEKRVQKETYIDFL